MSRWTAFEIAEAIGGSGTALRLVRYLASRAGDSPGGWVDVDLRETARAIGSSVPALKAALRRLRRSGLAEQKRPRSSLWRLSADAAWLLQAEPPARERGKEVAAAGSAAREG